MLNVKILTHTPNPENTIASAARLCYSSLNIDDLTQKYTTEQNEKMIQNIVDMGHHSPIEHVTFTFGIEGVSRSLTHQLVRHRISSNSQQSQRYVREGNFEYIIPPEISKDEKLKVIFLSHMEASQKAYDDLVVGLINKGRGEKEAIEDARYVFPNACETKIITTMNVRSLLNFFELRCCNRAQWEIRNLADEMLKQVRNISPTLFSMSGAACTFGRCGEGKMSCGKIRSIEDYV